MVFGSGTHSGTLGTPGTSRQNSLSYYSPRDTGSGRTPRGTELSLWPSRQASFPTTQDYPSRLQSESRQLHDYDEWAPAPPLFGTRSASGRASGRSSAADSFLQRKRRDPQQSAFAVRTGQSRHARAPSDRMPPLSGRSNGPSERLAASGRTDGTSERLTVSGRTDGTSERLTVSGRTDDLSDRLAVSGRMDGRSERLAVSGRSGYTESDGSVSGRAMVMPMLTRQNILPRPPSDFE